MERRSVIFALAAVVVELVGFDLGNRMPICAIAGGAVALVLSIISIVIASRSASNWGFVLGALSFLGVFPLLFLVLLWYQCAFHQSCL